MTSHLCVKSAKGTVKVHNKDGADVMRNVGADDIEDMKLKLKATFMPRRPKPSQKMRVGRQEGNGQSASKSMVGHSSTIFKSSISSLADRKRSSWMPASEVEEETNLEMEECQNMYSSLLQAEETVVKELDQVLTQADLRALRKKELLHKVWSTQVFEPVRRQVEQAVNSPQFADRDRRHRELYRQYLEHTNKRGHVFLDTMDEGEYYAQALNGHRPAPITVYTPPLQDPLLMQKRERNREEQMILRCMTGEVYSLSDIDQIKLPPMRLCPLGRHSNSYRTWLEIPLANIDSPPRKASRRRMKGNCTQSHFDFAHESQMAGDHNAVTYEWKPQKRMFVNSPPFDRAPSPVNRPP